MYIDRIPLLVCAHCHILNSWCMKGDTCHLGAHTLHITEMQQMVCVWKMKPVREHTCTIMGPNFLTRSDTHALWWDRIAWQGLTHMHYYGTELPDKVAWKGIRGTGPIYFTMRYRRRYKGYWAKTTCRAMQMAAVCDTDGDIRGTGSIQHAVQCRWLRYALCGAMCMGCPEWRGLRYAIQTKLPC